MRTTIARVLGTLRALVVPQVECQACGEVREARVEADGRLRDECEACGAVGNMVALDDAENTALKGADEGGVP